MKKSFKKAIAVLLAVLMVAFSVPFTALAAPGDYNPDIRIKFGTFHSDTATGWQDYTAAANLGFNYCGLYDVPLEYDIKSGTLTMSAAKAAKASEIVGYAAPSADYTYGVGDYFTATVVVDNIDKWAAGLIRLKYSENIEPAGYWTKSGRPATYGFGTVSEVAANGATMTVGGTAPLEAQSASSYYSTMNTRGNKSKLEAENRVIENAATTTGDYCDVTSVHDDYFADPETGDLSTGYTYNTFILCTWVFKIVGDGAISFEVDDPLNRDGCYMIGKGSDGLNQADYTTYAPNFTDDVENPGSCKMTLFGTNVNIADVECKHETTEVRDAVKETCTTDGYTGDTYCTECGDKLAEGTVIPMTGHSYVVTNETTSDCKTPGYIERTCQNCGDVQTEYKALAEHSYAEVEGSAVAATCTTAGKEADKECSVCGDKITGAETPIDATNHVGGTVVKNDKAADCGHAGYTGDTYCASCDVKLADGEAIPATGEHNYVEVPGTAVAATCVAAGKEADKECSVCGDKVIGTETPIDATNHVGGTVVKNDKAADCGHAGYTGDTYCASCDVKLADGEAIPATGEHNYVEVPGSAVEPTYDAPGKEADKECSVCGDKVTGATLPALKGLAVTVVANDRGAATVNGQAVTTEDVTVNVAQNSQVTLTATPNEGVKFVGWSVNGKLVSTEANATITALANMTIEPVYQVVGEEFTVIFMDKFGNVISTQVVKSAAEITVPAVPVIDGYTDAAWSLTADQIAALTESTIIKATYGTAAEKTYTVKAAGATITTPYATEQDVNAGIKYNTLVTVTADGAKAWEMNGKTVAYGDTYSFYVGSDVELVPVFEGVIDAAPTVAAVSTTKVGSEGAYKASFLATRSMTADCTYVNAGFVYAVNPASNELTLADVNGSTVLAAYCATDSDQFALTVGRQSQTGVIVARAFIAYVDAAGATQVAYAEPQTFDYSA